MLVQPMQLAVVRSSLPMFFVFLFKLRTKLPNPWQDFAIHPCLHARKKVAWGIAKDCCNGEGCPERRDTVPFFVARNPTAFMRTQQESDLALTEADSPAVWAQIIVEAGRHYCVVS